MLFLSPLALFGLVAALVPPLLHLFQRREPPVVEFPAVRYLRETQREAQRTVRLQHLLLMVLRILGVILIVLAAARPVVPGGVGAHHAPTALVLVFDNSLSSGAVRGGTRVLGDLAARARATLREAQAGDAVWIISADGIARRGTPPELMDLVSGLPPDARRLDLDAAVRQGARLVATSGFARGEVHVLSDLQASAFGEGSGESGVGPVSGTIVPLPTPHSPDSSLAGVSILVYHPSGDPPANLGVTSARAWPSLWLPGHGVVRATIAGARPSGAATGAVALTIAGRPGARALAAPGGDVELVAPALAPGWHAGEVSLPPDELRADDARPVALRVVEPAAVFAGTDPGAFVTEALGVLAAAGRVRLGGTPEVRFGTAPSGGGATIVLPPTDASALGATNRALAGAGVPWRLGARLEREDTIAAPAVPELAGVRVRVRYRLGALGAEPDGDVLARAGGEAWLVRHGRVIVLGSRLVPDETTLPVSGAFVPFLSALVNRIARGESGVIEVVPGGVLTLPDRASAMTVGDSLVALRAGDVVVAPAAPGLYALRAGADTVAMLVVAADARESDLRRATSAQLAARWPRARIEVTDAPSGYAARRFRGAGRSELTGWLLLAALVVLVAESLLAAGKLASWQAGTRALGRAVG
jgi:hypothetical protein